MCGLICWEKMRRDVITGLRSLLESKFELYKGLLKHTSCILLLTINATLCNYDYNSVKLAPPFINYSAT